MASTCFVRSFRSLTIWASSLSMALRCSGMFTAKEECRRKQEEANRIRLLLFQFFGTGVLHNDGVEIVRENDDLSAVEGTLPRTGCFGGIAGLGHSRECKVINVLVFVPPDEAPRQFGFASG